MNKFAEQETLLLKKMAELQEQLAKLNADKVARIKELKDLIPSLIDELYELEGNSYTWSTPANQDALESVVVEETAPVIEEEESQEEMIATTDVVDATEETLDEEQEQGETLEIEHLPRLDYLMSDKKHTKTKNTSSRKRPRLEDLLSENPIKDILLVGTKGTRHDYTTPAEFRIISVQGVCPTLTRSHMPPIMMCPPSEK